MGDRITERFEPQEPAPTYDWDFDSERRGGPKVLWGRVIALAALLIIAFALGRATAGGGDSGELDDAEETIADLRAENESLREELATQPEPTTSPAPDATTGATGDEGETYTVQKGDNLRSIAEDFYGDVGLDDCIARANDIADATQLSIGQELTIPPEESCE